MQILPNKAPNSKRGTSSTTRMMNSTVIDNKENYKLLGYINEFLVQTLFIFRSQQRLQFPHFFVDLRKENAQAIISSSSRMAFVNRNKKENHNEIVLSSNSITNNSSEAIGLRKIRRIKTKNKCSDHTSGMPLVCFSQLLSIWSKVTAGRSLIYLSFSIIIVTRERKLLDWRSIFPQNRNLIFLPQHDTQILFYF